MGVTSVVGKCSVYTPLNSADLKFLHRVSVFQECGRCRVSKKIKEISSPKTSSECLKCYSETVEMVVVIEVVGVVVVVVVVELTIRGGWCWRECAFR